MSAKKPNYKMLHFHSHLHQRNELGKKTFKELRRSALKSNCKSLGAKGHMWVGESREKFLLLMQNEREKKISSTANKDCYVCSL